MDGLNEYLQPIGSPVADTSGVVSGYQVNTTFLRNSVTQNKIPFLPISKITAGTIVVAFNLGSSTNNAYMILDGANNRIVINDGTTNRIVMGSV